VSQVLKLYFAVEVQAVFFKALRGDHGAYVVDEEQIKSFACQLDPEPFHLDHEAANDSLFSGLAASGWHTAAITMRLLVEVACRSLAVSSGLAASSIGLIQPAPATFYKLKVKSWRFDLRNPRPDRGVATVRSLTRNQRNEVVQRLTAKLIVARRV
jgi:acyl dehydratase